MRGAAVLGAVALSSAVAVAGCGSDDGPITFDTDSGGSDGGSDGGGGSANGSSGWEEAEVAIGPTGLRRLSRAEIERTLTDLVGVLPAGVIDTIPYDGETPFDNDYPTQVSSPTLVDGLFSLSTAVAQHVLSDPGRVQDVLGCIPSAPDDEACLRTFASTFARRALRRSLSDTEVDRYAAFIGFAEEEDDFDVAATMVFQSVLMDAEFLYRIETGEQIAADPVTLRLDGVSMATRLSYLLWGTGPDDALLSRAENGELATPADVRAVAEMMLADRRGLAQLQRFHAMWLDYDDLPRGSSLEIALHTETDKLVERVVAGRTWSQIFTLGESYLDGELAEHYSLGVAVARAGWIEYPDSRRAGILSHGAFLSVGEKFGDTSPVERGKAVWTRLLCKDMPPPPPDVDSGVPPEGEADTCKQERYDMASRPSCAVCHAILDPIGFGLENYGPRGEWRTHDVDLPECAISGEGAVDGLGAFAGAPSLGVLLAESPDVHRCVTQRYVQFAIGRDVTPAEAEIVARMSSELQANDDLLAVILDLVGSEAFMRRVVEQ